MQLYMPGRLKSICKFKEKQVADTVGSKRASARVNIKALQIQWLQKRASATVNIKVLQIQQLQKSHLQQQINREYRYIRKVNPSSLYLFQSRYSTKKEKTMQSSELESGLPDEAEQECIVFSFLEAVEN